jgi:two-component system cell cycle response regulator
VRRSQLAERRRKNVRSGLQAALVDPLTGLYNRRYAMPHLERVLLQARRAHKQLAVLIGDLDHFKSINDRFGHPAGDRVLVEVAERLRACLRKGDLAARIGGEEFMLVMPGIGQRAAKALALRICDAIARHPFALPGHPQPLNVTISIGMAICPAPGPGDRAGPEDAEALLERADRALYAAKGGGRNQVTMERPAA